MHDRVASPVPWASVATIALPVAAGALTLYFGSPLHDVWPPLLVINAVGIAGFALAAVLMAREEGQRGTAVLLGLAAVSFFCGWVRRPLPGPLTYIASTAGLPFWVCAGWVLLRYPQGRLERRAERLFVAVSGAWLLLGHAALGLLLDPRMYPKRWPAGAWWPSLNHRRATYEHAVAVSLSLDALVALWYVVLSVRRLRRMSEVDRWVMAPIGTSIVAAVAPLLGRPLAFITAAPGHKQDALSAVMVFVNITLAAVPISLVTVLVRQRITRAAVADMMSNLGATATSADIRSALRRALRDPTLDVVFWVPEAQAWVDPAGAPVAPAGADGRLRFPLRDADGREYGAVLTDPRLSTHRALVDAAVSAGGLALENARLQAALQAQLDQVRASTRRLAEVAVAERRRLERDLHDGVQQRLLALGLRLAEMRATGVDATEVIDRTRGELQASLSELRALASGIHPTVLSQSGLAVALEEVLDRLPFPVRLTVGPGRWPAAVESTAYYVVCEALSNVVKHARASGASVSIAEQGDVLELTVADDGRGGAAVGTGSGLTGLGDRVRALGGEFSLVSPPGEGTVLVTRLPCG